LNTLNEAETVGADKHLMAEADAQESSNETEREREAIETKASKKKTSRGGKSGLNKSETKKIEGIDKALASENRRAKSKETPESKAAADQASKQTMVRDARVFVKTEGIHKAAEVEADLRIQERTTVMNEAAPPTYAKKKAGVKSGQVKKPYKRSGMAKELDTRFQARLGTIIRVGDLVTVEKPSKKAGFNLSPGPPRSI
jgi:hypothetical protein